MKKHTSVAILTLLVSPVANASENQSGPTSVFLAVLLGTPVREENKESEWMKCTAPAPFPFLNNSYLDINHHCMQEEFKKIEETVLAKERNMCGKIS